MTAADKDVRREKLLEFLSSKEPAWKDEDHPEMKDSVEWVQKLRRANLPLQPSFSLPPTQSTLRLRFRYSHSTS